MYKTPNSEIIEDAQNDAIDKANIVIKSCQSVYRLQGAINLIKMYEENTSLYQKTYKAELLIQLEDEINVIKGK